MMNVKKRNGAKTLDESILIRLRGYVLRSRREQNKHIQDAIAHPRSK
jgi:hypothetical protein